MKLTTAPPPSKPGAGEHNRIGSMSDQLRRVHQPRPTPPAGTATPRRVQLLEARVSELERMVLMLLEQRGAGR